MKTNIRRLDSVTHNDTAATKLINDNFEALQQGIEDALSRSGKTPNFMDAELDMNTRRIINCGDPVDDNDVVTVKWFKDTIVDIDALENKVDQEIIDRTNADAALSGAISAETNRAQGVEGNLSDLTTTDKTSLVDAINELDGDISSIEGTIEGFGDIVTHDADEFATAVQGEKADTALQPEDITEGSTDGAISVDGTDVPVHGLGTAAYADSSDFAAAGDIPTVGNGSITLTQGGVIKGVFTTNQGTDGIIDLDAGGTSTDPCQYYAGTVSFASNSNTATIDVSSLVSDGVGYFPVVYILEGSRENITNEAVYTVATKTVQISRDPLVTEQETVYLRICLIPVVGTFTIVEGLTDGLYTTFVDSKYQLVSNLVTSVSSASTNSQYPSAKLFYDTCGDVETLINAL